MGKILNSIDFSDSTYKSIRACDDGLSIYFESWDENEIKVEFLEPIQFMYKLGDGVSGVFEASMNSPFVLEAISRCYSEIPFSHPYKCYEVKDLNDFSFITVIAKEVTVCKTKKLKLHL